MVNPKMYQKLMDYYESHEKPYFSYRYVDLPKGAWVVQMPMNPDRIKRVCNDHSIELVRVKADIGDMWFTINPDK